MSVVAVKATTAASTRDRTSVDAELMMEVTADVEHQFGVLFDEHDDVLLAEQVALTDAPTLCTVIEIEGASWIGCWA